jgi:serine/threonine protein kinase
VCVSCIAPWNLAHAPLSPLNTQVRLLQDCHHPHLLPLLGYNLDADQPCLAFPLMRGGSLLDRIHPAQAEASLRRLGMHELPPPLGYAATLRILRQTTEALLYLHTSVPGGKDMMIHRDLKPANILLDEELNAYLADTGFAKAQRADGTRK